MTRFPFLTLLLAAALAWPAAATDGTHSTPDELRAILDEGGYLSGELEAIQSSLRDLVDELQRQRAAEPTPEPAPAADEEQESDEPETSGSVSYAYNSGDCPANLTQSLSTRFNFRYRGFEAGAYAARGPSGLDCSQTGQTVDLHLQQKWNVWRTLDGVLSFDYNQSALAAEYLDMDGGSRFYNVGEPATSVALGVGTTWRGAKVRIGGNMLPDDYGDWVAGIGYERELFDGKLAFDASTFAGNRTDATVSWTRGLFHVALRREVGRTYVPVPLTQADGAHVLKEGPRDRVTVLEVGARLF